MKYLLIFAASAWVALSCFGQNSVSYNTITKQVYPTNLWFVGISTPTTPVASTNVANKAYVDAQISTINTNGFIASNAGSGTNNTFVAPTLGTSATFSYATATTVPYWNGSKQLVSSAVTPTQLGYLGGATGTTGSGALVFGTSPQLTGPVGINIAPNVESQLKVYSTNPTDNYEIARFYGEPDLIANIARWYGTYTAAHIDLAGYHITDSAVLANSSVLIQGAGGINYLHQFVARPEIDAASSAIVTNTMPIRVNTVNSSTNGGMHYHPVGLYMLYSGSGTNSLNTYILLTDITTPTLEGSRGLDLRMSAGTDKFNIYQSGTASNYFNGPFGMYAPLTLNSGQPVIFDSAGSQTAPAWHFGGYTQTGPFRSSANDIGWTFNGTAGFRFTGSGIFPYTDNAIDLGNASLRYNEVYALDGVFSQDVYMGDAGALRSGRGRIFASTDGEWNVRNAASTVVASWKHRFASAAKTAAYSILLTDGGSIFANNGASANVVLTLPSSPTAGLWYIAHCLNANGLTLAATNSHTIRMRGSTTASNGYVSSATVNAALLVVWDGSAWDVIDSEGPWTVDGTATTTGTGNLVYATSPTLVTPTLGVASATSLTTTGAIELGNASDTTLARSAAGVLSVEGVIVETQDTTHPTTTALTYSGTNVTLTASSRQTYSRTLTMTNNCLLTITTTDGANGTITLKPDSSTSYTVYLDSGIRMQGVAASGSFVVTNSATETVVIAWQAALRGASAFTAATKGYFP